MWHKRARKLRCCKDPQKHFFLYFLLPFEAANIRRGGSRIASHDPQPSQQSRLLLAIKKKDQCDKKPKRRVLAHAATVILFSGLQSVGAKHGQSFTISSKVATERSAPDRYAHVFAFISSTSRLNTNTRTHETCGVYLTTKFSYFIPITLCLQG